MNDEIYTQFDLEQEYEDSKKSNELENKINNTHVGYSTNDRTFCIEGEQAEKVQKALNDSPTIEDALKGVCENATPCENSTFYVEGEDVEKINKSIQAEYAKGNNNFIINIENSNKDYLLANVEGTKENPLKTTVDTSNKNPLEKALEIYDELKKNTNPKFIVMREIILKPKEINQFLDVVSNKYESIEYIGHHITDLIQGSYEAGNNDFKLDVKNKKIKGLCGNLIGKKDRLLKLTINGSVGDYCASRSKNIDVTINGNAGSAFGAYSENSHFHLTNDVGKYAGQFSNNSVFVTNKLETYHKVMNSEGNENIFKLIDKKGKIMREYKQKKDNY